MQSPPHKFYEWSKLKQNAFLFLFGFFFFGLTILSFSGLIIGWYWTIFLYPLIFVIAQFIDTPLGYRSGRLIYFSPLFLVEKVKTDEYVLHGGTAFDYFFVFTWKDKGESARRQVMKSFLSGLLEFAEHLDRNQLSEVKVRGSSYFFNERNAQRYGFEVLNTEMSQKIILGLNFAVLLLMYSFTKGKLSFPPIREIKTVSSTGRNLIDTKDQISRVLSRMGKGR